MSRTKKATTTGRQEPGKRADKAGGVSAVLSAIAAMPPPYRAMGERLHAIGFNDTANLDERNLWPMAFALAELTAAEEASIGAFVRKAVGPAVG